jgi:predicted dehydrogenase
MPAPSRREFLQASTLVAGSTLLNQSGKARAAGSPSDKLRVAVIGVEGRGQSHIDALHDLRNENVDLVAMCDVHAGYLDKAARDYEKVSGKQVKRFDDMRRVFDDQDIDAVTFATPNHWHALGTIWGCQAGKDVYVEKPGSQNFMEGRLMIEAARKHKKIVQHGTQCRSSTNIREGMSKLHDGAIGRVYMARVVNYKLHAKEMGRSVKSPVPEGLNWDGWVGPGPETPFSNFNWLRYNFRWDFGVGDIGNQGVHQLDLVRYGLKLDQHPTKVQAMGGNLMHLDEDDCECPCLLTAAYEFGDRNVLVTCETRDGYTNSEAGMGVEYPFVDHRNVCGVIFYGTEGFMIFPDYSSYHTFLGPKREPGPSKMVAGNPMMDTDHFRNWVEAIRSRKPEHLHAEIAEGHLSSSLCHLANVAYRVGRTVKFDPQAEQFVGDTEANGLLVRKEYRSPYKLPANV